ncbi:hypothetical protein K491DRAFT_691568 [Lophiostoma macrostomum CBS 122681]|uniref:DUF8035 domain-containing protein n=1 Tax=Lophiostoma macrostomum CBS 122681 TaxID=1314788 RepID=A0A6A6TE30_9PLEO|nr:hypothetical protein K491DRAFT_691568 [Lophiostoma macrostomum CBS 122681]
MAYRSSTGDLSYREDPPMAGQRWDRDRFERMRGAGGGGGGSGGSSAGGGRGRGEHDHFRFTEHDRFPGGRRDIDIHEDFDRRGPPVRVAERFREEERFDRPSRSRTELFHEPTPSEVANRALAPYRRKSVVEKDIDLQIRRPARPGYTRRQSSLDTFDRRPLPRYNEFEERDYYERDEWRPPTNVPIPLPIRERRRSPRRPREDDFEEVSRYREIEREREPRRGSSEEFREVEVKREKSVRRSARSRSRAARSIAATSVRSSSSSSFEEVSPVRSNVGRKGKTRMPKRLVKKQAIIDMGYPFEEEDDFIVVKRALEKDHIDEIIKISENYKDEKTTYVYEEKTVVDAPPPPPSMHSAHPPPPSMHSAHPPPPPPPETFYPPPETIYPPPPPTVIHAPPPPPSIHHSHAPPPPPSHYSQSVRSASPPRHEVYEERFEESNHIGGPLTVLVPNRGDHEQRITRIERDVRSERDIKDEIRQLEAERRMLKYERETDYEVIERREPRREVVRIEKDRKGRKKPDPKIVAAMMATLT